MPSSGGNIILSGEEDGSLEIIKSEILLLLLLLFLLLFPGEQE